MHIKACKCVAIKLLQNATCKSLKLYFASMLKVLVNK